MKKTVGRMCVACRESKDKKELLRIVRDKEGNVSIDFTGKKAGRGAYICDNPKCVEKCCKAKLLNRVFECDTPSEIYEEIKATYDEQHKA